MVLLIPNFESHTHINWKKLVMVRIYSNIQSSYITTLYQSECRIPCLWNDTTSFRITGYEIKIRKITSFQEVQSTRLLKQLMDIHQICWLSPGPGAAPFPETLRPNRWWNRWAGRSSVWPGCCHSWQVMKGMPPRSEPEFGLVKQGVYIYIYSYCIVIVHSPLKG